jgi:hypothetical protein
MEWDPTAAKVFPPPGFASPPPSKKGKPSQFLEVPYFMLVIDFKKY